MPMSGQSIPGRGFQIEGPASVKPFSRNKREVLKNSKVPMLLELSERGKR